MNNISHTNQSRFSQSSQERAADEKRDQSINDYVDAANADLAIVAESLAECALAQDCAFSVNYDGTQATLRVSRVAAHPGSVASFKRAGDNTR